MNTGKNQRCWFYTSLLFPLLGGDVWSNRPDHVWNCNLLIPAAAHQRRQGCDVCPLSLEQKRGGCLESSSRNPERRHSVFWGWLFSTQGLMITVLLAYSFYIILYTFLALYFTFKVLWLISQLFIFRSGFVYLISSSHIQTFMPFCFNSIYCK